MAAVKLLGNGLVILSAVLCWIFVGLYQVLSGGDWRRGEAGRHLMISMSTFAAVLTLTAVRVLVGVALDTFWFQALRTVVFAAVPAVFAWRIWLLLWAQRSDKHKERDDARHLP